MWVCVCLTKERSRVKQALLNIKHERTLKDLRLTRLNRVFEASHLLMWLLFCFLLNVIWRNGFFLCVPLSSFTSTQNDVISKLCTCAISLAIYLSLCKLIPVDHSIDADFVNSTPFYLQVIYLYMAMLALRPKYYFVWTFGELVMTVMTSSRVTRHKKAVSLCQ